jgi:PA14 domain
LPDIWELAHGLNPADPTDADQVAPGATVSNREKYRAGFEHLAKTERHGSWVSQDIGWVGEQGSAEFNDGTWLLKGSGADVYGNADGFQFVYQLWQADGEIVARLLTQENTDPWAKAGLMVRGGLSADAPNLGIVLTPENGLLLLKRESNGRATTTQPRGAGVAARPWLKLARDGSTFSAFSSSDGVNWEWFGTETLNIGTEVYFGLAVCSHDNSRLGTATFDQVTIEKGAPVAHVKHSQGSGDGLRANYFDSSTGAIVSRVDPTVNFDWDIDSPAEGIGPDFFSVRWEGFLEPQSTELYGLHVLSDDGARLWLDNQSVIDAWSEHGLSEQTVKAHLEAGRRYAIKLEYFERTGEAVAKLLWSSPNIPKQPIPQSQLYSAAPAVGTDPALDITLSQSSESRASGSPSDAEVKSTPAATDLSPAITGVHTVEAVAGSDPVGRLGPWAVEGTSIYAANQRGWVEYELTAPLADVYRLEIEGTSHNPLDSDPGFYLIVSIDNEPLGRMLFDAAPGQAGTVQVLTPWVQAGKHRVRLFWDNVRKGRSLQPRAGHATTRTDVRALEALRG